MLENISVASVLALSLPVILAIIGVIINKGFQELGESNIGSSKNIQKALIVVNECARTVVRSLNQTIVDSLKEKSQDGKLTDEEAWKVLDAACKELDRLISQDVKDCILEVFSDYDNMLKMWIERAVAEAKLDKSNKLISALAKKLQ